MTPLATGHTVAPAPALVRDDGRSLAVAVGDTEIARYAYAAPIAAVEAPKPFLHPLRTRFGALVTGYRPHDHRWHKGLQMTWSHVSGQNFWGGPTYMHGTGDTPLDNVETMHHDGFAALGSAAAGVTVAEDLTWVTARGEDWVQERRRLRWHGIDRERSAWTLDVSSSLRNVRDTALRLGSPTTHGREGAGYTGWFWRGPRAFTGGEVLVADPAVDEVTAMGVRSPWLAYSGDNDDRDGAVTLVMLAGSSSRGELRWFVRTDPFPAVNPSPAFDTEIELAPGETLDLRHRLVVADGRWTRAEIEACAAAQAD